MATAFQCIIACMESGLGLRNKFPCQKLRTQESKILQLSLPEKKICRCIYVFACACMCDYVFVLRKKKKENQFRKL